MTPDEDINKYSIALVEDMLFLDPETSLSIHLVDSDNMGMGILSNKILKDIESVPVIGVGSARVRHRLAFNLDLPVNCFSFITEYKSDLEDLFPDDINLVLWDYLKLPPVVAKRLIYKNWKKIDLVVVVPDLSETTPENSSLKSLIRPGMLSR